MPIEYISRLAPILVLAAHASVLELPMDTVSYLLMQTFLKPPVTFAQLHVGEPNSR